ncbi:VOC family protein [Catellatospora sp. NPDC049609]|uniref:VOC family protein n=1 Tax=Catellatospora sp. NPDC049609 TaxID=3155505 RepID=UPI00343FAE41
MARLGRKPVRPGRVTTAVCLGVLGLFVISMAAGLGSWPLGAVGVAMVVVGVALLTTASMLGADKAYVAGTVHVVKVSEPPVNLEFGRCEMQVLVDAPGHPGQTVIMNDPRVPVLKWPDAGDTLPALVAVSDARRIKIQWDRVATHGERFEQAYEHGDEDFSHDPDEDFDDPHLMADHEDDDYEPGPAYGTGPAYAAGPAYGTGPAYAAGTAYATGHDPDETFVGYRDDDPIDLDAVPDTPLPRRPSPHRRPSPEPREEPAQVAVLEGELFTGDVPGPRTPMDAESPDFDSIHMIDFAGVPEPAAPLVSDTVTRQVPLPDPAATPAARLDDVLVATPQARPAVAGSIQGVGITLLVTDLARSRAFYHDLLGFYEVDGGPGNVVLASGDTRLVLRTAQELAPVNRRHVHLNLEVGDVDAVFQELKVRGVRFTYAPRVVNHGERLELWAAAFKDPDGHGIAIIEWKAR